MLFLLRKLPSVLKSRLFPQDISPQAIVRLALTMIAAVAVMATVAVEQLLKNTARSTQYHVLLERSLTDRSRIRRSISQVNRAAIAGRGYVMTGEPEFRRSYLEAADDFPIEMQELRESLDGGPHAAGVERLHLLINGALERLAQDMDRAGGQPRTAPLDARRRGLIESQLIAMQNEAEALITAQSQTIEALSASYRRHTATSNSITIGLLTAILALVACFAALGIAYLEHRRRMEKGLDAARHQAEISQSEAEQASEAKTEFLASMSHEIRTPLTGILGYTELLLDQSLGPQQRRYVERIQTAGASLLTVVNDILDFSRIEAGEVTITPHPFPVRSLIDNIVSIVAVSARQKGLPVKLEIASDVPMMALGDKARIRQILLNLLINSIKFTDSGQITLTVAPEDAAEATDITRFTVAGSGIGISRSKIELLFKFFSQVDASYRRQYGGTGPGLPWPRRSRSSGSLFPAGWE